MSNKWIKFCFVVFYMGDCERNKRSSSRYQNRISYLKRTVSNALKYTERVCVFVCNDYDKHVVEDNLRTVECIQISCRTGSYLPCEACLYVQRHLTDLDLKDEDIIYFTEADHLLYVKNEIVDDMLTILRNDNVYASMHRMEEIYQDYGKDRGINCQLYGINLVLANTTRNIDSMPSYDNKNQFYKSIHMHEAYAGAYLITANSYRKVRINNNGDLESPSLSCYDSLPCLKTKRFTDIYIIHLSGYEYHASLAGVHDVVASLFDGE